MGPARSAAIDASQKLPWMVDPLLGPIRTLLAAPMLDDRIISL